MKRTRVLVAITVATVLAAAAETGAAEPRMSSAAESGAVPESRPDGDLEAAEATETSAVARVADLAARIAKVDASNGTYLIRLVDPAVPSYDGGEPGLAPTEPAPGQQLDPESPSARAYRGHLEAVQAEFIERMERTAGRSIEVLFTYKYAVNGIAAVLTADEALAIAADPGVASIAPDQVRELHTDVGPQWEGAEALWNAVAELGLPNDIKGEGIVIGTIDTGINPSNPSFADIGGDGHNHTNPNGSGVYFGVCDSTPIAGQVFDPTFPCNDKLIGAYNFIVDPAVPTARDYDGHGSHTASTSGGNVVDDVVVTTESGFVTPEFDISGVAPHANVISYRGCCSLAGLTASINQAIIDEVDVINYSIGSSSPSAAWDDFDTVGFLNARAAGIFVATSNGNDGPNPSTTGSPADAPWLTSVGASTHNRHNGNVVTDLNSSGGPLPDIEGKSVTGSIGVTPIVDAASVADPFCLAASGHEAAFTGRIVVCVRGGGGGGRVEKSRFVRDQGALGFILVNDALNADSLLGDEYAVPGVFISNDDGVALKTWLATGTGHQGAIRGTIFEIDDSRGDIMASFSSRGPNRAVETIVPAVSAPGVDILAALGVNDPAPPIHGFVSGTSMASPHVAGAGALLTQARPGWSPAQQQSALMTTANATVLNHDGTPATPYAQGSGRINVGAAARAGLLFDESLADYLAANPADGGDPKTLNTPSFADFQCLETCSWQRQATVPVNAEAPVPGAVTWTATSTSDAGLVLGVTLTPATVSPGASMAIGVTANVSGSPEGETLFGRITLTPSNPDVPTVTMPVAVVPSAGVLPDSVEFETRRDAGSQLVPDIQSIGVTEFTGSMGGLVKATQTVGSLNQDPTRADPYDNLAQVAVHLVTVPPGASRLVAEILTAEMPDLDMFVGTGSTPSLATEVCVSATGSNLEHCEVPDPEAGTWWVLIQNWAGTTTQPDDYLLSTGAVAGDAGNADVVGPSGAIPAGQPYDVRVTWDLPPSAPGDIWYGTAILGTSPATPGDIGSFPVTIHRVADDVTKTASVAAAVAGDTIDYEITVQPNVTDTDLVYTIVDTVPDGLTIDPASVTSGGVVDGQTITWEVAMPTAVGQVGTYVSSTPATDTQCAAWAGFLDLGPAGVPFAGLDGDTVAANAFSNIGPFEQYGQQFANLVVAEDGIATVAGGYSAPGAEPWVPQAIPAPAFPNGVFAPLWSDLELSLANSRGMRLATISSIGAAIIQWDNPFEFTPDASVGPSVGKFQAWVYNTVEDFRPEVTFEYATEGALPAVATIGIEDILGANATAVLSVADPSTVVSPGGTVCLDYEGPSFDPATLEYSATVATGALPGTYTNNAVHITDDPFAQPVTVSASVAVNRVCTKTITRNLFGNLTVSSGTTCINGALVVGKVTVKPGAGLVVTNSNLVGSLTTSGAKEVTICGSGIIAVIQIAGSSAVRLGDPVAGCAANAFLGSVKVTGTVGPTVIGGNLIIGSLACSGNNPPPVNHGAPNQIFGRRSGQCAGL